MSFYRFAASRYRARTPHPSAERTSVVYIATPFACPYTCRLLLHCQSPVVASKEDTLEPRRRHTEDRPARRATKTARPGAVKLRTATPLVTTVGDTGLPYLAPKASPLSLERADELRSRAARRADIPLRAGFVRNDDPSVTPPLAQLVSAGGRGGGTPLKLYLGLVWIASAPPFDVPRLSSRVWAELLDLEDPSGRGKKRVAAAITRLEELRLIHVSRSRGEPSKIRLLREDGSGAAYKSIPSTAYHRAAVSERQRYFKINTRLWTEGHVQSMSPKALAMLLVVLEEQYGQDAPVWFSESRFVDRFGLSRPTKSEGGKELLQRQLVIIKRAAVTTTGAAFERERTRNTYRVINAAVPHDFDPS